MNFDFTSIISRQGHDALAVEGCGGPGAAPAQPKPGFDFIPMWVADMNFATCPSVTRALTERLQHPLYGYFNPSEDYFSSIIQWQQDRNGVTGLEPRHIGYENGVLGGVISALSALAAPGDPVLLHSPTYLGFTHCMDAAGFRIVLSPLRRDAQGVWRMDYEDMDARIKAHKIHVAVLCSPHNPMGRVWEREELEKAMEVYRKNDVYVISDEIWSDITLDGHRHIPTQSVSPDARMRTVALYAPSKTFNLAGLVGSYHIIYNSYLRDRVCAMGQKSHYNNMNVLSMHALIGAYTQEGRQWVDALRQVISRNAEYACDYIRSHFEGVDVSRPEGTYMLFINCGDWCRAHGKTIDDVLHAGWDVGVGWQDGRAFHGPTHIRINLALPFERVQEAFRRMDRYVFNP